MTLSPLSAERAASVSLRPVKRDYYEIWLAARALAEACHLVGRVPAYPELADIRDGYLVRAEKCIAELKEAIDGQ